METIKTAAVVVLLLGVLYGVYVVLNKPELSPPPGVEVAGGDLALPEIQIHPGGENVAFAPDAGQPAAGQPGEMAADFPGVAAMDPLPSGSPAGDAADHAAGDYLAEPLAEFQAEPDADPAEVQPLIPEYPLAADQASPPAAEEPPGSAYPVTPEDPEPFDEPPADYDQRGSIYRIGKNPAAGEPEPPSDSPAVADGSDLASVYAVPDGTAEPPRTTMGEPEPRSIRAFDTAWDSAVRLVEQQNWTDALFALSLRYNDADLSAEERQRMVDLLDPLAGKVIYSREHTLAPPHVVRSGETLEQIAQAYQVPAELLQNINGVRDVQPGMELKVVPGPFRAQVDVESGQLILFAKKYYAGRFPISLGSPPSPGEYAVQAKQPGKEFVTPDGRRLAAGAPNNPFGRWWLDLGADVSIHGSPDELPPYGFGSISLKTADAADVYGILSLGSRVEVR